MEDTETEFRPNMEDTEQEFFSVKIQYGGHPDGRSLAAFSQVLSAGHWTELKLHTCNAGLMLQLCLAKKTPPSPHSLAQSNTYREIGPSDRYCWETNSASHPLPIPSWQMHFSILLLRPVDVSGNETRAPQHAFLSITRTLSKRNASDYNNLIKTSRPREGKTTKPFRMLSVTLVRQSTPTITRLTPLSDQATWSTS
jgi:hypothetical protein